MSNITKVPSANKSVDEYSAYPWTNPGNVYVADGSFATFTRSYGGETQNYYHCFYNFGFNIPSTATILGIRVDIVGCISPMQVNGASLIVNLTKNKNDAAGNSRTGISGFTTDNSTDSFYSGSQTTDLWGTTWTPSEINSVDFGVTNLSSNTTSGTYDIEYYIDRIRIVVFYTDISPSVSPSISSSISASNSPSTSTSVSPSTSISQSPSISPSTSISVSPSSSISTSVSPSTSVSISPSTSVSQSPSLSPSTSVSISPSTSTSISPSSSISESSSISISPSISPSTSISASPSQPDTTALLIDYWHMTLLGSTSPSQSPSISPSISVSVSPSTSISQSPSVSPSTSISISPSISPSSSISASVSPSTSVSVSPSISISQSPSLSPSVSSSLSPSESPSASPSPSPSRLLYKLYKEDGTYVSTLSDVISDLSITKEINGGDGAFAFTLARRIDDFGEGTDIDFNYRVKVYLFDSFNPTGVLVAYGYILSYEPYLNGKEEGVNVTCLSAVSKLSNDYYRLGTSAVASELGVELADMRADEMMTAVVNHYRSTESNSMIGTPSGLDQTTDNAGALFDFTLRIFNKKHIEALREIAKYFARFKSAGYWFYWRINTAGNLIVKNISTTATHKFVIGKHITNISGSKTMEGMVNRVYFWNEKGTTSSEYLKSTTDDTTSQNSYDIVSEYINDSSVTNINAANLLSSARIYDNKDPKVKIKVTLNGEYNLASIEPGQTCQIFNLKNNPYKLGSDSVLFINSITYEVDSATLEIAEAADDFTDMVQEERDRLSSEMTWFGYISQQLTAAQLGPADRTWSTDILFTATSDKVISWSAGTVYLATSSSSSAGKRVIDAGNTGTMSTTPPIPDYYIYLNESTINVSATASLTGTGTIQQGSEYLTDSTKAWTSNQWQGYIVTFGTETRIIRSNTTTVLTLEESWLQADTSTSYSTGSYTIRKMTFEVTTDKSAVASSSNVIFGTAKSNAVATSQATVVPTNSSSTDNYTFDGTTNIAERSITYLSIAANTITANEINTGAISVGSFGGSLDDIDNGSTYYKATANQVTGGGRGYTGLDSSGYVKIPVDSTKMSFGSAPSTGIFIDSTGIYGRYGGNTMFSLLTSDGSGYFAGELGSTSVSTGEINVYLNGDLRAVLGAGVLALLGPNEVGAGQIYGYGSNQLGFAVSSEDADYIMNESAFLPTSSGVYDLGSYDSPSVKSLWNIVYANDVYLEGTVSVATTITTITNWIAAHTQ